ncbi:MAG: hypothetical protein QM756_04385 [Polyangiaceae bacterium]
MLLLTGAGLVWILRQRPAPSAETTSTTPSVASAPEPRVAAAAPLAPPLPAATIAEASPVPQNSAPVAVLRPARGFGRANKAAPSAVSAEPSIATAGEAAPPPPPPPPAEKPLDPFENRK